MEKKGVIKRLTAVLGSFFLLSACAGYNSEALGPPIYEIYRMPPEEARLHLAGKTVMTFVDSYRWCQSNAYGSYCKWVEGPGTQVDFLAEDGSWFLWSPGITKLTTGKWAIRRWREEYEICFSSQGIVSNVIARKLYDDGFKCALLTSYAAEITDTRAEDEFDLASGRLPFRLDNEPTTIDDLLNRRE